MSSVPWCRFVNGKCHHETTKTRRRIKVSALENQLPAKAGEESQRGQTRHEEVGAGPHRHEARQRRGSRPNRRPGNGHPARRLIDSIVVSDNRILVVVQTAEARVVAPGLLHEFELTLDAGVDAEEMNAARLAVIS